MRLLVSVRSASEVKAALEGGAEIIDAKEPRHGSLGAVEAETLALIGEAVPDGTPLSVALGDHATEDAAARAMDLLQVVTHRSAELYVKVGLAGLVEPPAVLAVLTAAVRAARGLPLEPSVIAVAYADHRLAATVAPHLIVDLAAEAGARGVLMDTWGKDGRTLFASVTHSEVRRWLDGARSRGLLTALAGSLTGDQMDEVRALAPDVVGVRGAACETGRDGVLSARLVQQLSRAAHRSDPSLQVVA